MSSRTAHPAILDAGDIQVPLFYGRNANVLAEGNVAADIAPCFGDLATLEQHPDVHVISVDEVGGVTDLSESRPLAFGDLVGAFTLTRAVELVVSAHASRSSGGGGGDLALFNPLAIAPGRASRWRAVRSGDGEVVEVLVDERGENPTVVPALIGVDVVHFVSESARGGARVDAAIAGAVAAPYLRAHNEGRLIEAAVVTWDGCVNVARSTPLAQLGVARDQLDERGRAIDVALTLAGHPFDDEAATAVWSAVQLAVPRERSAAEVSAFDAILATRPAPATQLASIVRGLFPDAWALESAIREQARLLDVEGLPSVADGRGGR